MHSFWFTCFMGGFHQRIGDLRRQDKAITINIILAVDDILEHEWKRLGDWRMKLTEAKRISEMGFWFIVGFVVLGFRGEEMPLIEEAGTRKSLHNLSSALVYFSVWINGRTKGQQNSGSKFKIPCIGTTEGTGLRSRLAMNAAASHIVRKVMNTKGGRLL
jgi:hypothetical protein